MLNQVVSKLLTRPGLQRRAEVGADGLEAEPREVACEAPVVVELFG